MTENGRKPSISFLIRDDQVEMLRKRYGNAQGDQYIVDLLSRPPEGVKRVAGMANDWECFNGPRDGSNRERSIAISRDLSTSRPQVLTEKMYRRDRNPDEGQRRLAPYLSEEVVDELTHERQFHISLTYSASAGSPEDALRAFFSSMRQPGDMTVQISEEGIDEILNVSGDDLARIASDVFGDDPDGAEPA